MSMYVRKWVFICFIACLFLFYLFQFLLVWNIKIRDFSPKLQISLFHTSPLFVVLADPGFSRGGGGAPTPKSAIIFQFFAENCMKMKEFGPPRGGARPWRPPLDPPVLFYFFFVPFLFQGLWSCVTRTTWLSHLYGN